MILINVLPPEHRRRDSGVSPVFLAIAASLLVNLVCGVLWAYVHFSALPTAQQQLTDLEGVRDRKRTEAAAVDAIQKQITAAKKHKETLFELLESKVYTARSMYEFLQEFNSDEMTGQGFNVSFSRLEITPRAKGRSKRGASKKKEDRIRSVDWKLSWKLVGELGKGIDRDEISGQYIQAFFANLKNGPFWNNPSNGFEGSPIDTYVGDTPSVNAELGKVVISGSLGWVRKVQLESFAAVSNKAAPASKGAP